MTAAGDAQVLDREELRRLFDLRSSYNADSGGGYTDDPYPVWQTPAGAEPDPRRRRARADRLPR